MSLQRKVIYYILTGARKAAEAQHNIKILRQLGASVYVITSKGSEPIVNVDELEEVSGHFVRNSFIKKHPDHSLPLEDIVIMAPATYNSINKIANGIADTLATSLVATAIGRGTPVYVAPNMNYDLWSSLILQKNIKKLRQCGVKIIHPQVENDKSTMAERLKIIDTIIHDFVRIRYEDIEIKDELLKSELNNYRQRSDPVIREIGERLESLQLNGATAGCLSIRLTKGFLITTSGSSLGDLKEDELSLVYDCDHQKNIVWWCGNKIPSSETPLHYMIYSGRKDVQSVIHSHCPHITYGKPYKKYRTNTFYSYGTFDFGENVLSEMVREKSHFIIAKDHGQIVVTDNLNNSFQYLLDIYNEGRMAYETPIRV